MVGKVKNILTGWGKRFGFLRTSESEKKLSEMRLKICGECIHAKKSKLLEIANGNTQYVHKLVCGLCHCPCLEKSLVATEKCPINKW